MIICLHYYRLSDSDKNNSLLYKSEWLGKEEFIGINEAMIPKYSATGPVVTITKVFESQKCKRWKLQRVDFDGSNCHIYIIERNNYSDEEFLSQTHKNNKTVTSKLQFGTMIEVEFGHVPAIFTTKITGPSKDNFRYPDSIHSGEMHKRRLCIVVKAHAGRVQVVPVSSKAPTNLSDETIFEVSQNSLGNLTGYNDPSIRSYAICNMIKTVSSTRVLPPMAVYLKGAARKKVVMRDVVYNQRLNPSDRVKLKDCLVHAVGVTDYALLKATNLQLNQSHQELKSENSKLIEQVTSHALSQVNAKQAESERDALLLMLADLHMSYHSLKPKDAEMKVRAELDDYLSILNSQT